MFKNLNLILFDINPKVCDEFYNHFNKYKNISIYNGRFENIQEYDCIISPANSFGLMDGGIDKFIIDYFGKQLMENVQKHIIENYAGEQPVGTSFIIETNDIKHPYLAHTPTMEIPMDIRGTNNVYKAMKAMLLEVLKYNKNLIFGNSIIRSIACSGLGTACGMLEPSIAVKQMELAYKHVFYPIKEINWNIARDRYMDILNSKINTK